VGVCGVGAVLHHREHAAAQRFSATDAGLLQKFRKGPGRELDRRFRIHGPVRDQERAGASISEPLTIWVQKNNFFMTFNSSNSLGVGVPGPEDVANRVGVAGNEGRHGSITERLLCLGPLSPAACTQPAPFLASISEFTAISAAEFTPAGNGSIIFMRFSASAGDEGWTMTTSATVLVVDDDPILLTVVTHKLTSCGYRVITAADGAIGLSQARAKKPDIIVLDMMMPTLDGRQVLNALQADSALASVPVIVLTSRRGEHDVIDALQHGDYLAKPFSPDELVARIARLITKPQPARS